MVAYSRLHTKLSRQPERPGHLTTKLSRLSRPLSGSATYVVSEITANSCRFEQAFSEDGGRNWEVNWIAVDTRVR
jgi:hypothetical protein